MVTTNAVIAIYNTHDQAENAIKQLQHAGFNMQTLSIAAKDTQTQEQVVGYYTVGDRMKRWGRIGAFWGGFWGLLYGAGLFAVPQLGFVLVAGPLVSWVVGALEGAAILGGVSAIGAGLISIGIPKDSVLKYDVALKTDKYLLIAHGLPEEVTRAKGILDDTSPLSAEVHGRPVLVA